jgi:hypothetical protein
MDIVENWYIYPSFGILHEEKSGNAGARPLKY